MCLKSQQIEALALAVDCLEEARELDGEVREQVEELLTVGLESHDPKLRKLAAKVKLARRLKQFQRIDDTTEIDTDFITCAEYQLFLDEMWDQEKYYQPDHWTVYTFFETTPKLSATDPVLGVRAEGTKTFVNWLNDREKATYRLPTPTEAKEFPTNMESVATWCYEDKKFTLGGLGKSEHQGIEQRLKKLSTLPLLNHWISLPLLSPLLSPHYYYFGNNALGLTRSLDLAHALDSDLARRDLARDRDLARSTALDLALACFATTDQELYTLLNKWQFNAALQRIRQLQDNLLPPTQQRKLTLLIDLINCQTATTTLEIRQAFRKYAIHLLEYAWIGLNELEKEIVIRQWWQFWKRPFPKVAKTDYLEEKQKILELYWRLKITEAREAGELPAWEGIRLVRVTAEK